MNGPNIDNMILDEETLNLLKGGLLGMCEDLAKTGYLKGDQTLEDQESLINQLIVIGETAYLLSQHKAL